MALNRSLEDAIAPESIGEAKYAELHRARLVKTPEFRQAMKFVRLHGLVGLDELRKAWVRECDGERDSG